MQISKSVNKTHVASLSESIKHCGWNHKLTSDSEPLFGPLDKVEPSLLEHQRCQTSVYLPRATQMQSDGLKQAPQTLYRSATRDRRLSTRPHLAASYQTSPCSLADRVAGFVKWHKPQISLKKTTRRRSPHQWDAKEELFQAQVSSNTPRGTVFSHFWTSKFWVPFWVSLWTGCERGTVFGEFLTKIGSGTVFRPCFLSSTQNIPTCGKLCRSGICVKKRPKSVPLVRPRKGPKTAPPHFLAKKGAKNRAASLLDGERTQKVPVLQPATIRQLPCTATPPRKTIKVTNTRFVHARAHMP